MLPVWILVALNQSTLQAVWAEHSQLTDTVQLWPRGPCSQRGVNGRCEYPLLLNKSALAVQPYLPWLCQPLPGDVVAFTVVGSLGNRTYFYRWNQTDACRVQVIDEVPWGSPGVGQILVSFLALPLGTAFLAGFGRCAVRGGQCATRANEAPVLQ